LRVLTLLESAGVDFVLADLLLTEIDQIEKQVKDTMLPSGVVKMIRRQMLFTPEAVQKARTFSEAQSIRKQREMAERKKAGWAVGAENPNAQNLTQEDRLIGSERGGEATKQKAIEAYAEIAELVRA